MTQVILVGIIGKILIFLIQKFTASNVRGKFLVGLVNCSLCLGFWVYLVLSMTLQAYLFSDIFFFPVVSAIITGAVLSFVTFLISLGWNEYFGAIVIE